MAKIAYILLCHKDPEGIIAQARRLTASGDFMAIHFDARASAADFDRIRTALADNPSVAFVQRRVQCGWGEWSLVAATLRGVEAAVEAFPRATHFYLLSGDCMSIKSAEYAHAFLDAAEADYIECFDFMASDWIKTGIKEERLIYRHFFNERSRKRLFYASLALQKRLNLKRRIPQDLQIQIGSQWWCLRRRTIEAILTFLRSRPDVIRFFRRSWIPDETFFQTLVRHLVPESQIRSRTLTFLMFSDYGMPVTFYNDHFDLLVGQDFLFARKISPDAKELKARLGDLYAARGRSFPLSNEGAGLHRFLTGRGRIGRRFAPRFWETEATLGRERTLMIITCKKWHVAKRLVERVRNVTNLPALDYLFNEASTPMPDLGGIETTLEKRTRHRRALVRMLFDYWQTDDLVLCIDPSNIDLMQDFHSDRSSTRILEVECDFTDDYLIGHARRVGLAGVNTSQDTIDRLLPTIRYDLKFESDRLRDSDFDGLFHIRQSASMVENTLPLAEFLGIPPEKAQEIAATDYLFVD
ncbi:MAG: glycosyl transferase [Cereibacter sphaeroides]|uniref:Peptide O-xylosyltransferase n=1 Tax=Cereibacter sphaeroides TaxID=1063 RepID=A0A2W5S4K7_CERSP|nr:MAG: glycosyl transferase [Cereibacter sphaeroides]